MNVLTITHQRVRMIGMAVVSLRLVVGLLCIWWECEGWLEFTPSKPSSVWAKAHTYQKGMFRIWIHSVLYFHDMDTRYKSYRFKML